MADPQHPNPTNQPTQPSVSASTATPHRTVKERPAVVFLSGVVGAFVAGITTWIFLSNYIDSRVRGVLTDMKNRDELPRGPQGLPGPRGPEPIPNLPVGSVIPWPAPITAGTPLPQDWMLCDGTELPTAGNEKLFTVINTTWGGSSHAFRLPDLRGVFLRGADLGAGQDPDGATRQLGSTQQALIGDHKHKIAHTHTHGDLRVAGGRSPGTNEIMFQFKGKEDIGGMTYRMYPKSSDERNDRTEVEPIAVVGTTGSTSADSTGVDSTSTESRPVNKAINFIIKVR